MSQSIRQYACALVTLAALAACSDQKPASTLSSDSSLARDLTIVENKNAPVALSDTAPRAAPPPVQRPASPPPRTQTQRPASAAAPPVAQSPALTPAPSPSPAPASNMIPVGATTMASIGTAVCSNSAHPGDKFIATLVAPLTAPNGQTIPAGSKAVVEVATVTPAEGNQDATMTFRLRSIDTDAASYPIAGDVMPAAPLEKVKVDDSSADKKKVIGGAVVGGLLGQLLGKNAKGTVIGAAAGAAAGTAAAKLSNQYEACLQTTNSVRIALAEGLTVR